MKPHVRHILPASLLIAGISLSALAFLCGSSVSALAQHEMGKMASLILPMTNCRVLLLCFR
jgi:hypothetical protein